MGTAAPRLRIEVAVPNFFSIPTKQMEIDARPELGRTYFIHRGAIVAVARFTEASDEVTR